MSASTIRQRATASRLSRSSMTSLLQQPVEFPVEQHGAARHDLFALAHPGEDRRGGCRRSCPRPPAAAPARFLRVARARPGCRAAAARPPAGTTSCGSPVTDTVTWASMCARTPGASESKAQVTSTVRFWRSIARTTRRTLPDSGTSPSAGICDAAEESLLQVAAHPAPESWRSRSANDGSAMMNAGWFSGSWACSPGSTCRSITCPSRGDTELEQILALLGRCGPPAAPRECRSDPPPGCRSSPALRRAGGSRSRLPARGL